jgi:ABC-type dipeptide/oligopeptide/nickel transport system permease subunit
LGVKSAVYVDAARTMGATNTQIIARHVLPNIVSPLLVQLSLAASSVLLAEAGLSFLGLGVQPPQASWGSMIRDAQRSMNEAPFVAFFPGIAITLAAISFNMASDGLSKAMARRGTARDD